MSRYLPLLSVLAALSACDWLNVGGDPPGGGGDPTDFPAVTDFESEGSFPTIKETSDAECTIHRPETLGEAGRDHPVIIWGNGTAGFPAVYAGLFDVLASHGFIVVAANTSNAGTGEEMLACLDWVLGENVRIGSAYFGHVDGARVGASGHSQGGGGAIMTGRDPRVITTAPIMPYVVGLGFEPGAETMQSGPMLLLSGGTDFIAAPSSNQEPVFVATNVPVFWGTLLTAGHTAALGDAGKFRGAVVAWFRYQLMDDELAATWFEGDACVLCESAVWRVEQRDL